MQQQLLPSLLCLLLDLLLVLVPGQKYGVTVKTLFWLQLKWGKRGNVEGAKLAQMAKQCVRVANLLQNFVVRVLMNLVVLKTGNTFSLHALEKNNRQLTLFKQNLIKSLRLFNSQQISPWGP
mmetsp:Transcript_8656/g.11408  ORF Transcript_8656/g.11408 Transcript_8656/m.11408 type:complete len:122 (+) Transcript_8656:113-478(+)